MFFFKQLPLNIKEAFEFSFHLIESGELLSVVVGEVSISVYKSLDFHDTTLSVLRTVPGGVFVWGSGGEIRWGWTGLQ